MNPLNYAWHAPMSPWIGIQLYRQSSSQSILRHFRSLRFPCSSFKTFKRLPMPLGFDSQSSMTPWIYVVIKSPHASFFNQYFSFNDFFIQEVFVCSYYESCMGILCFITWKNLFLFFLLCHLVGLRDWNMEWVEFFRVLTCFLLICWSFCNWLRKRK